jgi:hypothetical protein
MIDIGILGQKNILGISYIIPSFYYFGMILLHLGHFVIPLTFEL